MPCKSCSGVTSRSRSQFINNLLGIYPTMYSVYLLLTAVVLAGQTDGRRLVDLTHTLDSDAPKWPLPGIITDEERYFKKTDLVWIRSENYWSAISYMEYYEHMGTHIDAPIHLAEGRQTVDQIPVDKLMGPGVVFDIKEKASQNPDYLLTVADIEEYEAEFGRIPDGAIALLNSGWGVKYPRSDLMFGTDTYNDSTTFHFPGYSKEAAVFLLTKRFVRVVGIDTPSVDAGQDLLLTAHVYLQSQNVPLLEYVANLDSIPQSGITVFLGAPKFRGGTGGPTRVIAVVGDDSNVSSGSSAGMLCHTLMMCALAVYNTV